VGPTCLGRCLNNPKLARIGMPYKRLFHNSLFGSVGEQQKMVYMDEKRKPFTSYEGYFFFFVN
jgi:hypothetical protein